MVAIVGEACSQRGNVDEEVGLHDDDARCNHTDIFFHVIVEQVQLHSRPQRFLQIGEVAPLSGVAVIDADRTVGSIGVNIFRRDAANNAAHIILVDAQTVLMLTLVGRQQGKQQRGDVGGENG